MTFAIPSVPPDIGMTLGSSIFSASFPQNPSIQRPCSVNCPTCGTTNPWMAWEADALLGKEVASALVRQETVSQEAIILQPSHVAIPRENTPAKSDVGIGPLLVGITILALRRGHRH